MTLVLERGCTSQRLPGGFDRLPWVAAVANDLKLILLHGSYPKCSETVLLWRRTIIIHYLGLLGYLAHLSLPLSADLVVDPLISRLEGADSVRDLSRSRRGERSI